MAGDYMNDEWKKHAGMQKRRTYGEKEKNTSG